MKFTYKWLKDFVDIEISPQKLAASLTLVGLEVISLEKVKEDFVFEVEITSNRTDLLSIIGIAREVAAIMGKKIRFKGYGKNYGFWDKQGFFRFNLKIENEDDCPLYTARIIRDVKIESSPDWLKERLLAIGIRPVNNIVDITNYVQVSLGQPLHAFDLDRIEGDLIWVRRAKDGERIITIDNRPFNLNSDILLIADARKPIAIAGIMGGKETEIGLETKNILLESAKFNAILIRRMRQRLGLTSESQYRFERDLDINNVIFASDYAVRLIKDYCKGRIVLSKKVGSCVSKKRSVIFNPENVLKVLGKSPSPSLIIRILKSLGFIVKNSQEKLKVEVPTFRKDIKEEIDLIEEVARLWGYDKIPLTLPYVRIFLKTDTYQKMLLRIRNILINQGVSEVINYSLLGNLTLKRLKIPSCDFVTIANPLSHQQEVLRPLLLPGLLFNVSKNIRYKEGVGFFEIGRVFLGIKENNFLGLVLCGKKVFLKDTGKTEDNFTILHLKGIIELILGNLGIKNFDFVDEQYPYLGNGLRIMILKEEIGYLGKVDSEVLINFDINKKDVFAAELNLDKLVKFIDLNRRYKSLPIYPGVRRDISLVIPENISLKEVLRRIEEEKFSLLKEIKIVDFYKGSPIPSGFRSVTLSCFYYSDIHTLTDIEVNHQHLELCNLLKKEFSVEIR
ncbi:MAG: phenylalanine--tRNA ligase subunit beta [Candidatus Omnitrophica bacterium]|nr:phenylalanine--tRNA ligase subunit beta [Candidatus Omnitrophota bacterium]